MEKKLLSLLLILSSCSHIKRVTANQFPKEKNKPDKYLSIEQIRKKARKKFRVRLLVVGGVFALLGFLLYRQSRYNYPPLDTRKTIKGFFLYKIEQEGGPTSYLHGVGHIRSKNYVVPNVIKKLPDSIDRVVTEVNLSQDQDLKKYRNIVLGKILEEYEKLNLSSNHASQNSETVVGGNRAENPSIHSYIEHIKEYQKEDKLEFFSLTCPWLAIKYDGVGKYSEEELYHVFEDKEKGGLETIKDEWKAIGGYRNLDPEQIAEEDSVGLWELLKKYMNSYAYRKEVLDEADIYDETTPVTDKQSLNWIEKTVYALKSRNNAWMPKMVDMMKEKRNFIAVGALHVNHLLLLLLYKKKYTITRILESGKEEPITLQNYNKPFV